MDLLVSCLGSGGSTLSALRTSVGVFDSKASHSKLGLHTHVPVMSSKPAGSQTAIGHMEVQRLTTAPPAGPNILILNFFLVLINIIHRFVLSCKARMEKGRETKGNTLERITHSHLAKHVRDETAEASWRSGSGSRPADLAFFTPTPCIIFTAQLGALVSVMTLQ